MPIKGKMLGSKKKTTNPETRKGEHNEDDNVEETAVETFGEDSLSSKKDLAVKETYQEDLVIDPEGLQESEASGEDTGTEGTNKEDRTSEDKPSNDTDVKDTKQKHKQKKKQKIKASKTMDVAHCDGDSLREEDDDRKTKKTKKNDIKKAFRNFKSKLSSKKKSKNEVQEICIKPETESPQQCWGDAAVKPRQSASSSRTSSANSKNSKTLDNVEEDEDGIEVIYDAAYQGGECE